MSDPNVIIDALADALGKTREEVGKMTWRELEKGMRRLEKELEAAQSDLADWDRLIAFKEAEGH